MKENFIAPKPSNNRSAPGGTERGRTRLYAAAAFIALVGLVDAIYLTVEHLTGQTVACFASGGCQDVLGSNYATIGMMPLAAFGAVAYFAAFSAATLAALGYRRAGFFLAVLVAGMFGMTVWLLYLQAFVLHAFCDYCLISAALIVALSGIVVTLRCAKQPR